MLFLQFCAILCLLATFVRSYPVFGTKRYGRSSGTVSAPWASAPVNVAYQQPARAQRFHPVNYYDLGYPTYGARDEYPAYYSNHEAYPIYYAPARTSKYEVYQAVLPYYYEDRRIPSNYRYYGYDAGDLDAEPVDNLQEEILQEQEREEREEASPIGQEMWYENDGESRSPSNDEDIDEVNAAFLQNLILSQMYNNALDNKVYADQDWQNTMQEDEDVRELKQLAVPQEKEPRREEMFKDQKQERMNAFRKGGSSKKKVQVQGPNDSQKWHKRNQDVKGVLRKGDSATVTPVTSSTSSAETPARDARGGQKEVMLMRPATPIRHPFSEPVMEMLAERSVLNKADQKRVPSVYNTIKQMLEMEKNLEKEKQQNIRPPMKKRFVMNEETLVKQLSGLKSTGTA